MNMLEKGAQFLARKRTECLSVRVTYLRRGEIPLELSATKGSTLFRCTERSGVSTCYRSVDFLVADPGFVPKRGDKIDDGISVFEVLAPAGEQVWRASEPSGVTIRIHTKRTGGSDVGI